MQQTSRTVNAQPLRAPSDITRNPDRDRLLLAMQRAVSILRPGQKLTVRWHEKQATGAAQRAGQNGGDE